jgi:predicted AlkP superfamily pyrophosphatase or phosphodiesterase
MNKIFVTFVILFISLSTSSQVPNSGLKQNTLQRPKLIVGIVVDQMRWDYLYRYYDRYQADGGFKQMLSQGFSCENTLIPYTPTVTACGHTCIYTGSVPAINGIIGNEWWDYTNSKMTYCAGDMNVTTVGSTSAAGQMSPRNLLVTTIGDEMHLASNFHNKVIGVALKDRASILPAGHSANAAYWFDDLTGGWISSTYYMNDLPNWVKELNAKKMVDQYFAKDWKTLYPIESYTQSTPDDVPYENKPFGKGFPYLLSPFIGKNYGLIHVTPYGNSFTFDMAEAAIQGEQLGTGNFPDLLAISLSSPDYIGHTFGPNSIEAEDGFLRLDKDLGDFLRFLDKQVGKGNYLIFLSADHGVAQVPGFLKDHKIPAGSVETNALTDQLNNFLKDKFKSDKLAIGIINYQVYFDHNKMNGDRLNRDAVYKEAINFLSSQPGVSRAIALEALTASTLNPDIKNAIANGYNATRSGDIQLIYWPQWIDGFEAKGTTHGVWNPYDSHIPLLWYGWNIQPGQSNRRVYMSDIAPTLAALLHIQMPSGSVGRPIEEIVK